MFNDSVMKISFDFAKLLFRNLNAKALIPPYKSVTSAFFRHYKKVTLVITLTSSILASPNFANLFTISSATFCINDITLTCILTELSPFFIGNYGRALEPTFSALVYYSLRKMIMMKSSIILSDLRCREATVRQCRRRAASLLRCDVRRQRST